MRQTKKKHTKKKKQPACLAACLWRTAAVHSERTAGSDNCAAPCHKLISLTSPDGDYKLTFDRLISRATFHLRLERKKKTKNVQRFNVLINL